VAFVKSLHDKKASVDLIQTAYNRDFYNSDFLSLWKSLPAADLILLCAYAFSNKEVMEEHSCPFSSQKGSWTWSKIRDTGYCTLVESPSKTLFKVAVPYVILHVLASTQENSQLLPAYRAFHATVNMLLSLVDTKLYSSDPWQLWEFFGACFHALRINALLIVGDNQGKFSDLIAPGSLNKGCDDEIELRPMRVFLAQEALSNHTTASIKQKYGSTPCNWLEGEDDGGFIVINFASGEGVDIWFSLKVKGEDKYIIVLDQRKREAGSAGATTVSNYVKNALGVFPGKKATDGSPVIPKVSKIIVGLFSMLASANVEPNDLPADSFVISYPQHEVYHGQFCTHPAATPCISINSGFQTHLQLLKVRTSTNSRCIKEDEAKWIVNERASQKWADFDSFWTAFQAEYPAITGFDDRERVVFY
jgi:hypothetical protein